MTADGADELLIEGYRTCRCGAWVPDHRSPVCDDCRGRLNDASKAARVRYEVEGRTFTTRAPKPKARKPHKRTPKEREDRRAADRAKMRAYVRLSHIYDPMFRVLLDEERIAEGLAPSTITRAPRPVRLTEQLEADIADAAEQATGRLLDHG